MTRGTTVINDPGSQNLGKNKMVLDQISKEDPLFVICEVKTKDQEELKRAYKILIIWLANLFSIVPLLCVTVNLMANI